jgi:hypothetical protein
VRRVLEHQDLRLFQLCESVCRHSSRPQPQRIDLKCCCFKPVSRTVEISIWTVTGESHPYPGTEDGIISPPVTPGTAKISLSHSENKKPQTCHSEIPPALQAPHLTGSIEIHTAARGTSTGLTLRFLVVTRASPCVPLPNQLTVQASTANNILK